jgi:hypothetical protein
MRLRSNSTVPAPYIDLPDFHLESLVNCYRTVVYIRRTSAIIVFDIRIIVFIFWTYEAASRESFSPQ